MHSDSEIIGYLDIFGDVVVVVVGKYAIQKAGSKQEDKLSIETFNRIYLNNKINPFFPHTQEISFLRNSRLLYSLIHTHAHIQYTNTRKKERKKKTRKEKTDFPIENSVHIDLICI